MHDDVAYAMSDWCQGITGSTRGICTGGTGHPLEAQARGVVQRVPMWWPQICGSRLVWLFSTQELGRGGWRRRLGRLPWWAGAARREAVQVVLVVAVVELVVEVGLAYPEEDGRREERVGPGLVLGTYPLNLVG